MNITIREKNGKFQAILSYKQGNAWKQKAKQGFETKKAAKQWANEISFNIMEDKKDGIEQTDLTVKDALEIYLNYKKNTVRQGTYNTTKIHLQHINFLKDKEISKIKPIELSTYFQELQNKTGNTYKDTQHKISTFFNFCIKELKIIRENPLKIQKRKREDKRVKYISKELYEKMLQEIKNEQVKLFIKIAYNTGMRKGEIFGLKQTDIKDCIITVTHQREEKELKTENSKRQIPIPTWIYNEIKSVKIQNINGYIFEKEINLQHYLNKYKTSPHCFRHTFATNLVAKGINLKVASDIIGDKFETFINTYVQSSEEEKQKAFKQIING